MEHFAGEFIGTMLLLIMGCGVVANVVLSRTKGHQSGWIVITFGWAMAVFLAVYASTNLGGSGHLNPAVTIAMSLFSDFNDSLVLPYVVAQLAGAFVGSSLVWLAYKPHFDTTQDRDLKLAVFSTAPAIRSTFHNFFTELLGTFVLVFGALAMSKPSDALILPVTWARALLIFYCQLPIKEPATGRMHGSQLLLRLPELVLLY